MRRLALVILLGLLAGACSSDDSNGSADPEEFCNLLSGQAQLDPSSAEGQAYMDDLERTAPDEVADDIDTMLDMFEEFAAISDDDPDGGARAAALLGDPSVLDAVGALDSYGVSECGFAAGDISGQTGVQGPALTSTVP